MACNGICLGTRVSERKELKEERQSEGKDGCVVDGTYHAVCFRKKRSPVYSRSLTQEMGSPAAASLFILLVSHGTERGRREVERTGVL